MIDVERVRELVHGPDSPRPVDELARRLGILNGERVREMDRVVAGLRDSGSLSKGSYELFRRELGRLGRFGRSG